MHPTPLTPASTPAHHPDGERLLADIGAVHLQMALEAAPGQWRRLPRMPVAAHASPADALRAGLALAEGVAVRHVVMSLPTPILGDAVKLTNHSWSFSVEALRRELDLSTLLVVNDFHALAVGLTRLTPQQRVAIGGGKARADAMVGIIGSGSGLGMAGLLPGTPMPVGLPGEGGHVGYAPLDEDERAAVRLAQERYGHASAERLISAPGLVLIHDSLHRARGLPRPDLDAPAISAAAMAVPPDPLAWRALDLFCAMLGSVAGNLALTLGATGGIYVGGTIVPRILPFFVASRFRERFEDKGRMRGWLERVPTWVIDDPDSALRGAAALLEDHLNADRMASPLLADVRVALERLTGAERAVAADVLSAPRAWLSDPIGRIAERCGVSTPTVMRFCRSMGFKGLADFKLRLGSGLSGSARVGHTKVLATDPPAERIAKIFDNSISALVALRDRLHPEAFEAAVQILTGARRIEIYGVGAAGVTAEDAQNKLGRLGLPAVARADPGIQGLSAPFLGEGDAVLAISNVGNLEAMNRAAARACRGGARLIAICPQRSDLARLADVVLAVDHPEDAQALVPMVSRLMQSVILDVLVSDIALQRRVPIEQALSEAGDRRFVSLSTHCG